MQLVSRVRGADDTRCQAQEDPLKVIWWQNDPSYFQSHEGERQDPHLAFDEPLP